MKNGRLDPHSAMSLVSELLLTVSVVLVNLLVWLDLDGGA